MAAYPFGQVINPTPCPQVIHAVERLSSDVESVSTDLAALAGSVEALGTRARVGG
jgi:hypothetical protein